MPGGARGVDREPLVAQSAGAYDRRMRPHRPRSTATSALLAAAIASTGCGARVVDFGALVIGGRVQGELTATDPIIAIPGRGGSYRSDTLAIDLVAGEPVTITMCEDMGSDFDPYLSVAINGQDVHFNDDGAGGFHGHGSLVTFTPTTTGEYTVFASTFRSNGAVMGAYTLQVFAGTMTGFRCPGA